jgi:transcriptional regulator with XRE-family HTH domain
MMSMIDKDALKRVMNAKRMTPNALAAKSGLSPKTIGRLLDPPAGRGKRPYHKTVFALANALDVSPDDLAGKIRRKSDAPVPLTEGADTWHSPRSQINVRIDHATRNAIHIIAARYGVKIQQIVKLAPLLFLCVAEQSLARRRAKLEALAQNEREAFEIGKGLGHLSNVIWANPYLETIAECERASIDKRDIFARDLFEKTDEVCSQQFYDNEYSKNPFAIFLKDFVRGSTPLIQVDQCGPHADTTSLTTEKLFEELYPDDPILVMGLANGIVGLHEIPHELKDSEAVKEWLLNVIKERIEEIKESTKNIEKIISPAIRQSSDLFSENGHE